MINTPARRVAKAIAKVVSSRFGVNRGYLRVPELVTPFPIREVLEEIASLDRVPRVAVFGPKIPLGIEGLVVTSDVPLAISWRDDQTSSQPLLIIGDLEREKAAGLQSVRTVRDRDIRASLFADTRSIVRSYAMPLAVEKLVQRLQSELNVDLLSCADYCVALENAGQDMSEVARTNLWRVGLLPDTRSPDIDRTRLSDNASLVEQLRTSDAGTVQRLMANLPERQYRAVRNYALTRSNAQFAGLEFEDIKAAFKSVAKKPGKQKTPTKTDESSIFVLAEESSFSEEDFLGQLADREGSEGSEAAENSAVRVSGNTLPWDPAPVEQFADWLSAGGTEQYAEIGGSTIDLDAQARKTSSDPDSSNEWTSIRQCLEAVRALEERTSESEPIQAAALCEQLISIRRDLIPYLEHIPNEGVRLLGVSDKLLALADDLVETWVGIWSELSRLNDALDPADREYVSQIGNMLAAVDVRVELAGGNVVAQLLPLHPVVIEPRVAAAKVLREHTTQLDEEFVSLLSSSVDPGLPGITVTAGDTKRALSYSGTFKDLPLYEAKPRQAEGIELNRTVQQIVDRFVNVHPYTRMSLSVCLVGPSPKLSKAIIKWLANGQRGRIRVDLFTGLRDLAEMRTTVDSTLEEVASSDSDPERFRIVVHEGDDVTSVARRMREDGVRPHLIIAFDLSEVHAGKYAGNLEIPLQGSVITQWSFNVNPITTRPVIRPTSGSGRLIRVAEFQQSLTGLGPPSQERSPLLTDTVTTALAEMADIATWVALCEGASPLAAPSVIGGLQLLGRSISGNHVSYVYSEDRRMLLEPVLQYLQQSTWIHPQKNELADFLLRTVRMALPEGLLGFFKTSGSLSNESVLGRLGVAAALAYLQDESSVERLIVSLDSQAARQWLNLRTETDRRADLLTFTWTNEGVSITAVEVKARTEPFSWSEPEPQPIVDARAQVAEMMSLLRKIFRIDDPDSLTPSRREVLKRQVFLEALQQWDGLRETDKKEYERRVKSLSTLFNDASSVSVESEIFIVSTNETAEVTERASSDGATPIVVLGVPWLRKALQARSGGHIDIPTDLLDEFSELFDDEESNDSGTAQTQSKSTAHDDDPPGVVESDGWRPARATAVDADDSVPESHSNVADIDLDELAVRVREALLARGAALRIVDTARATIGPSVVVVPFKLAQGARLSALQSQESDIARDLQVAAVRVSNWSGGSGFASIELPRPKRQIADVSMLSRRPEDDGLQIALGVRLDFKPYLVKMDDLPHLLVAGTTGSGKSVFLRSLLWQLTKLYGENDLDLVLIDAKGMADFIDFRKAPHIKNPSDYHLGVHGAVDLLADIVERRLPERREAFNSYAAAAIERADPVQITSVSRLREDARARGIDPGIRPLVVVIDEFAELVMGTADRKRFETLVTRFNQVARAIGGHLIAATQRPSADVVTGVIKGNFARLALRVQSAVDSKVILDESGANSLLGKGDLLFRSPDEGLIRIQGYNAPGPYQFVHQHR